MEKVSDWHVEKECGCCGTTWKVYVTDLVEKRYGNYRAYCGFCKEVIRVPQIPKLYSKNFDHFVQLNKMVELLEDVGKEYEIEYLKNNSIFHLTNKDI